MWRIPDVKVINLSALRVIKALFLVFWNYFHSFSFKICISREKESMYSLSFFSCYLSFSGLHATRKKNPERFAIQKRQDIKERSCPSIFDMQPPYVFWNLFRLPSTVDWNESWIQCYPTSDRSQKWFKSIDLSYVDWSCIFLWKWFHERFTSWPVGKEKPLPYNVGASLLLVPHSFL